MILKKVKSTIKKGVKLMSHLLLIVCMVISVLFIIPPSKVNAVQYGTKYHIKLSVTVTDSLNNKSPLDFMVFQDTNRQPSQQVFYSNQKWKDSMRNVVIYEGDTSGLPSNLSLGTGKALLPKGKLTFKIEVSGPKGKQTLERTMNVKGRGYYGADLSPFLDNLLKELYIQPSTKSLKVPTTDRENVYDLNPLCLDKFGVRYSHPYMKYSLSTKIDGVYVENNQLHITKEANQSAVNSFQLISTAGTSSRATKLVTNRTTFSLVREKYNVQYHANANSSDTVSRMPNDQKKTALVDLNLSTAVPKRVDTNGKSYDFLGWATSPTGKVAYQPNDVYKTNKALNLYAIWQRHDFDILGTEGGKGYLIESEDANPVKYGGSYRFSVKMDEVAYELQPGYSTYVVKVNNQPITADNGIYTLENILNDTTISVEGLQLKRYQIDYTQPDIGDDKYYTLDIENGNDDGTVDYGTNAIIKIKDLDDKWDPNELYLKVNNEIIKPNQDGQYIIENVTQNTTISVENFKKKQYTITTLNNQCDFIDNQNNIIQMPLIVEYGDDLSFKVQLKEGYSITDQLNLSINNNNLTPDNNGYYTLSQIKDNTELKITGIDVSSYDINFNDGGNSFVVKDYVDQEVKNPIDNNIVSVKHGNSYQFVVETQEGYDPQTIEVKVNNEVIEATTDTNGHAVYTIQDIREAKDVQISVSLNRYTMTTNQPAITLNDTSGNNNVVEHGHDYSFTITKDDTHYIFGDNFKVYYDNQELTPDNDNNNVYTINNITNGELQIKTSSVTPKQYPIEVINIPNELQVKPDGNIDYNSDAKFYLEPKDPNDNPYVMDAIVIDGVKPTYDTETQHYIYTIKANNEVDGKLQFILAVDTLFKKNFRLTDTTTDYKDGYTVTLANSESQDLTAAYGQDCQIKITLKDGYARSKYESTGDIVVHNSSASETVKCDKVEGKSYYYTFENITDNINFSVSNITQRDKQYLYQYRRPSYIEQQKIHIEMVDPSDKKGNWKNESDTYPWSVTNYSGLLAPNTSVKLKITAKETASWMDLANSKLLLYNGANDNASVLTELPITDVSIDKSTNTAVGYVTFNTLSQDMWIDLDLTKKTTLVKLPETMEHIELSDLQGNPLKNKDGGDAEPGDLVPIQSGEQLNWRINIEEGYRVKGYNGTYISFLNGTSSIFSAYFTRDSNNPNIYRYSSYYSSGVYDSTLTVQFDFEIERNPVKFGFYNNSTGTISTEGFLVSQYSSAYINLYVMSSGLNYGEHQYGTDMRFYFTISESRDSDVESRLYDCENIEFSIEGIDPADILKGDPVTHFNGKVHSTYVIKNVTQDVKFSINKFNTKKYQLTYDDTGAYSLDYAYDKDFTDLIEDGKVDSGRGTYYVRVTPKEGYKINTTDAYVTYLNMTNIEDEGGGSITYNLDTVSSSENKGIFEIKTLYESDWADMHLKVGGLVTTDNKVPIYFEKNVNNWIEANIVTVQGAEDMFNRPNQYVNPGETYRFKIEPRYRRYVITELIIKDKDTGEIIEPDSQGVYTIENVTTQKNIEYTIKGEMKKFTLYFPYLGENVYCDSDGNPINTPVSVNYGESFTFKLNLDNLNDAFTVYSSPLSFKANNTYIYNSDSYTGTGTYTIDTIYEDQTITALGLEYTSGHQVSFTGADPSTYEIFKVYGLGRDLKVSHGEIPAFEIKPKGNNHFNSVKINGQEITPDKKGRYIYRMTEPVLEDKILTLSLGTSEEPVGPVQLQWNGHKYADFVTESGSPVSTEVNSGADYRFRVNIDDGYDTTQLVVKANGVTLTPDENQVYTLSQVNDDQNITIEGVVLKSYTVDVQYKDDTMNGVDVESLDVTHGAGGELNVTAKTGYDISLLNAVLDGKSLRHKDTWENGRLVKRTFTLENILKQPTIVLSGASRERFAIELPTVPGCTIEKVNENDQLTSVISGQSYQLKLVIADGFDDQAVVKAVYDDGSEVTFDREGNTFILDEVKGFFQLKIEGIKDTIAPTGEVFIQSNSFSELLNTLTFNQFFKDKINIRIEANDAGSGVDTIQYYLKSQNTGIDQVTQPLTQSELESLNSWQDYTIGEAVTLEEAQNVVVYAKIKDVAGNVTYLSSDGAVIYKEPFIDSSSSLTYDFNDAVNEQSLSLSHVSSIDKVFLDGEIIDPSYYELNNGNLIFKNLNSLLSQVSLGQHEISISVKPNGVTNETLMTPLTIPLEVKDTGSNHTHDWQDAPSDSRNQEATYLKSGQKVQKCNKCDRYQLVEIPKLEDTTDPDISFVVNGDDEYQYTRYNDNPNQLYLDQTPTFSISAQAKDEQTDIKEMSYYVASETLSQNQMNSLDWQPLLMIMPLSESHYTHNGLALIDIPENTPKQIVYVKVVNGADQVSYASSHLYIIDSTQPEIINTQMEGIEVLSNGVTIATSDSTISASVKDDNSGIDVSNSAIIFTPVTGEDENGFIYDEDQALKKSISSQGQVTLQLSELLGENKFSGKVELFVSDNAGNTTSRILVNHLVIDSDEPSLTHELTGTKTSTGYYSNPDNIQFKLKIKDSENAYSSSGIASVSVKDGNQEIYSNKYTQFLTKVDINDINLSTLKDGIHQLTIEVKDYAGNVKTMTLQDIKIDFIEPHVEIKDSSTVGINQASLDMNSSDTGTLYYLLLSPNDAQPTINNLLASSTKKTVTANEDIQLKLQSLTPDKDYKLYYLVENSGSKKTSQIQTYELHTSPKQDISQNVALKKNQWTYGDQVSEVELNVGQYVLDIGKLDISYQKGNTVLNQIPTLPGQYQAVINYEDDVMIIHKTLNFTIQQKELTLNTDVLTVSDKKYDGTKDATVNGLNQLQLSGIVNQDEVQLNVNDVKATFDQKDAGEDIAVTLTGLKLAGQAKDYYKLPEIELKASITKANGIDNLAYGEGLLTIQNMHFIENKTSSTTSVQLPDNWKFKTNAEIKATSTAKQAFEFIYESQDSNYEDVEIQLSLPVSRIEVDSSLVTMTELQKAKLLDTGLNVIGAPLTLTDFNWQTSASNIIMRSNSVNELNITPLKNGLAVIGLHHGQDDTVLAVFNIFVNDVHANTKAEDISNMLDQLKNLDPKDPLSKDLSEAVLEQVVSMESKEKEKISVDNLEELEELLKATHDVESQTTVTNDSIVKAEDIHVIGSIPSSGMTEGTMETVVNTGMSDDPLNPELKIDVVLNHDNQEKEMQTPIYVEMTLPTTINLETSRLVKVHEDGSLEEIEFVFDRQWVRIKVSDDKTLMFVPKEFQYTIETNASNGGTISPLGKTIVKEHDNLDIMISPNKGYHIDKIIVDGEVIETVSTYHLTDITKNHTIYVSFVIDDSQIIKPDKNETSQSQIQTQVNQTNANTAKTADQMLPSFWITSGLLAMITFIVLMKKKKHE